MRQSASTIRGFVLGLLVLAGALFAVEALHELSYASSHPYAYGPAKVIATVCGAGLALTVALGLVVMVLLRQDHHG